MTASERPEQIREIFEEYYLGLVEFCSRLLKCSETARDIVQDVFVKLLDKKVILPVEKPVLKSYLFSMVRNAALNYMKRQKLFDHYKQTNQESKFSGDDILDAMINAEAILQLHQAIQSLPQACRNICELTYLQENSNNKAAEISNTSINTVKTQKRRAVTLLRKQIVTVGRVARFFLFF